MKIILDNREITMNNVDDKSFSWVLEEVTDLLERDGRMLFYISMEKGWITMNTSIKSR